MWRKLRKTVQSISSVEKEEEKGLESENRGPDSLSINISVRITSI